jgi:hypothetical protein
LKIWDGHLKLFAFSRHILLACQACQTVSPCANLGSWNRSSCRRRRSPFRGPSSRARCHSSPQEKSHWCKHVSQKYLLCVCIANKYDYTYLYSIDVYFALNRMIIFQTIKRTFSVLCLLWLISKKMENYKKYMILLFILSSERKLSVSVSVSAILRASVSADISVLYSAKITVPFS